jgi:secreted trypsin-like serine protease
MPKSTVMCLRWVLASSAALVVAAWCCAPAGAIVGGSVVADIEDAPYQVAIVRHDPEDPYFGMWCGGSVRDRQHIITAAHCVFDNDLGASGQPVSPDAIDVVAGTVNLGINSGARLPVKSVSFDDDYDPATYSHDAAVLTLNGNLQFAPDGPIEPIPLIDRDSWEAATPGTLATVTGWGETISNNPNSYLRSLRSADVPIVSDGQCGPRYQGFVAAAMTCAGDATRDSCFGDSGGPLVVPKFATPGAVEMLGIVSFGPPSGCAIANYPGVYTEVYDADISAYLAQANPVSAPRTVSPPSVQGTVAVGSTVSCNPGTWDGAPSFSYQFVVPTPSGDVARTAQGAQSSYTVQPADAGNPLACNVKGTNAGGLAFAESAAVTVPVPQPSPPFDPPHQSPSQTQQDTAAPVARVTKATCTATRCTLNVTVTDAGFSAGIKTVQSSVRSTYRSRCRRNGRTVACTKHRTTKPRVAALTSTHFKIVASKLPFGTQRFTLFAVDKAGHRQALPTTKTVTTKKPRQRR